MTIEIKIIYDNCKGEKDLQEGWGFSCLVNLGHRKILFDTGADAGAFFANLQKLGIRCSEITDVVYSHKHSDHVAGFQELIGMLKEGSRLFLPKRFPAKRLSIVHTEIVEDLKEIDSGVYTLVLKGGLFLYEQALLLETKKGLIVITGCAHPGIVRLLQESQRRLKQPIHLVLGGFHLFRSTPKQIDGIVDQFKALKVQIAAPCHCSGDAAIERFRLAFQDRFYKIGAGTILTIEK